MDTIQVNSTERTKGISGSWLKIIAVISMLVDHTAATILERLLNEMPAWGPVTAGNWDNWYTVYVILRGVGRMAFPIYCFLLVEGFTYTKSKAKYALRLFVFALISEVPFDMALQQSFWDMSYNNVFFTLLIGLLVIAAVDWLQNKASSSQGAEIKSALITTGKPFLNAAVIVLGCWLAQYVLKCDYGIGGILAIVILYVFREHRMTGFTLAVITLGIFAGVIELAALLMLIPLHFYNGTRGRQMKYFFYAFYPVHLLILALICYALGLGIGI